MRKLLLLLGLCLVTNSTISACDACGGLPGGGYIGILPQFTRHFVGVRYQMRYFSSTHQHTGALNEDYLHTWNIWGRFSPHKRVQLYVNMPIHYFLQEDEGRKRELAGPGDIWVMAQYQLIRSPDSSSRKMRHSLSAGGGIKLPTGRYNMYDEHGFFDRYIQPGTGSWDFLASAQYTIRWKEWGLNAEANASFSTMNPDNYLYGHKVRTNLKGFYWGQGPRLSVLASAGLSYDYGARDIYLHQGRPETGGHQFGAVGSADIYMGRFALGVEFRLPIYAKIGGGTLNPGPQIMSQFLVTF